MKRRLKAVLQTKAAQYQMKVIGEVLGSLLLALLVLRASGSIFGMINEWKLRAGKS